MIKTLEYKNNRLKIIDQRRLPLDLKYIYLDSAKGVKNAIKTLAVRGAPAIGVACAYGFYISAKTIKTKNKYIFFKKLKSLFTYLNDARPTAVNLSWALGRVLSAAELKKHTSVYLMKKAMLEEARRIHLQDMQMCRKIGEHGNKLINNQDAILTHCNAGILATSGIGTALAPIYTAKKSKKKIKVYASETRPLLQGGRLTAWELLKNKIDVTLICDNMAAAIMKSGAVKKIIVGADRIAANGDVANKTGTYNLAVLANAHKIPFFVAAPGSTFDFKIKNGSHIPIEQRGKDEIIRFIKQQCAPGRVKVYNPAFDVTPHSLITAFITDKGIIRKPFKKNLSLMRKTD